MNRPTKEPKAEPYSFRLPESLDIIVQRKAKELGFETENKFLAAVIEKVAIEEWGYIPPFGYRERPGQWLLKKVRETTKIAAKNGAKIIRFCIL